jgi:hypothetical protein
MTYHISRGATLEVTHQIESHIFEDFNETNRTSHLRFMRTESHM